MESKDAIDEVEEDKLTVRDANGNNVNFSDRLNKALQDAADYTGTVFLNIREYWEKVKAIAREDGVNEADYQREFRHRLRGKLSKHQIYYLFHREERLADMKARQQLELESRKFATFTKRNERLINEHTARLCFNLSNIWHIPESTDDIEVDYIRKSREFRTMLVSELTPVSRKGIYTRLNYLSALVEETISFIENVDKK